MISLFRSGRDHYLIALQRELRGMEEVLELGCGGYSPLAEIGGDFALDGVDLFEPALDAAGRTGRYRQLIRQDVTPLGFGDKTYDAVLALDLIEHLPHDKGNLLLEEMERVARRKVILMTPNGFLTQEAYDNNPWQVHLSGWKVADFRRRQFRVKGMNGLRFLRGEKACIRWKPRFFWRRVSDFSEHLVKPLPWLAFQLLAIKETNEIHL